MAATAPRCGRRAAAAPAGRARASHRTRAVAAGGGVRWNPAQQVSVRWPRRDAFGQSLVPTYLGCCSVRSSKTYASRTEFHCRRREAQTLHSAPVKDAGSARLWCNAGRRRLRRGGERRRCGVCVPLTLLWRLTLSLIPAMGARGRVQGRREHRGAARARSGGRGGPALAGRACGAGRAWPALCGAAGGSEACGGRAWLAARRWRGRGAGRLPRGCRVRLRAGRGGERATLCAIRGRATAPRRSRGAWDDGE